MKMKFLTLLIFLPTIIFAQFGQNKVQFNQYEWYFIQTKHFDIYFTEDGKKIAEFASKAFEDALTSIENSLNYRITNRITGILYNSGNNFQETNVTDEYLSEGIGGFTELFKNRVVVPFTGDYKAFRHVIHHELVHAVMNDMFYGGSIQNIISRNITIRLPLWFNEGLAEYLSLGWDTNTDMFIRDAATSEYLPDIQGLDGYFAYRGGQALFSYIAKKYGKEKISELVSKVKSKGNIEDGFFASLGLTLEELNERWKKDVKKEFWPDIAKMEDPDEYSKRLTDHRKDGGFYNISPAINPEGDKIAFISNKDFYFDVYLMDATKGKEIKKLVEGNRSPDFEELNILTPGLTFSPDGKQVALAAKSNGFDVIYVIDVESEDINLLPIHFDGISSLAWSPDGKQITFSGHSPTQSDIYIFNFESKEIKNLTNDIFSDSDPAWTADGKMIYFSSDRGAFVNAAELEAAFMIYNYDYFQKDLYRIDVTNSVISRVTNFPNSDETSPIVSPDGKEILFISDMNGINNIYKLNIQDSFSEDENTVIPITNSLNGVYQLSLSADGKKLTFSSMYQSAYNIFLLTNPFQINLGKKKLELTKYYSRLESKGDQDPFPLFNDDTSATFVDTSSIIFSGQYVDTTSADVDTSKNDFSTFIFGKQEYFKKDSIDNERKFEITDNFDTTGNYKINRYKINFSTDIVYANAGYSTFYGLLGTTIISLSDVLGDHRLIGQTSLQIDLKNSDYGLAYYYLPNRFDLGIELFHTARFLYLTRGNNLNLFRFRNYGMVASMSYPLNRFYRLDGGLSVLNASSENLEDYMEPTRKITYVIPAMSFVHDNTIFGYTAPIDGSRYRFDLFSNPFVEPDKYGFTSILGDYRSYTRFWGDYSFAFRFAGGYSVGANPQRFFLGGIDNWINYRFGTGEIPIDSPSDFAFLTPALPMRGFNYAEQIGSKYSLMNFELRFPLIRYLVTGGLPLMFRNILGSIFIDAGSAWNKNDQLKLFGRNSEGKTVTKDLLTGMGFGSRIYFLSFLVRLDMAWAYNFNSFSEPIFYFSLGTDF